MHKKRKQKVERPESLTTTQSVIEPAALGKAPLTFAIQPKTSRRFLSTGLTGVPVFFLLSDVSSC